MDLQITRHAQERMAEQGISRADVEALLERPERTETGETATIYEATVDGRPLRAVVVRDSQPPRLITVFEVTRR